MTIRAIIAGRLWKPAEQRQSSTGKLYATATLAIDGAPEGQPRFARVTAFGDEAATLVALPKGAAVSATGRLELGVWTPEGKPPEVQMRMVADALLTIAPARGRASERPSRTAQEAPHGDEWDVVV